MILEQSDLGFTRYIILMRLTHHTLVTATAAMEKTRTRDIFLIDQGAEMENLGKSLLGDKSRDRLEGRTVHWTWMSLRIEFERTLLLCNFYFF